MTALVTDYGGRLESINKMLTSVAERSTVLLPMFLDLSNPVTNTKHEWVDKALVGFNDTLKTALTSTTTSTVTVNGHATNLKRYIAGLSVLRFGGSDELMLVTSVITIDTDETKLNVTRAYRSTTAATYSVNTEIKIIGNPQDEGFDVSRDDAQQGSRKFNYTQIFSRELKLSGSSQAVTAVGQETQMAKQAAELQPEILKELERAVIHGTRFATSTTELERELGGLRYWANTNSNETDQGGAAISWKMIEGVIETFIDNGGDASKLCLLVPTRQQRKINDLKEARIIGGGQSQSENTVSNFVTRYDFGGKAQVEVIYTPDLFNSEVYYFQKGMFKVKPLQGRQSKIVDIAKTGDHDRKLLIGEFTLQAVNTAELLFRHHNLDTTV